MAKLKTPKPLRFFAPERWLTDRLRVLVVGAGGTGGEVIDGLAQMAVALNALGHPGLAIQLCDGDTVSESNVGRQRFGFGDIGAYKVDVLAQRYALEYGVSMQVCPEFMKPESLPRSHNCDLILTCVDRARFRAELAKFACSSYGNPMWLDFGNGRTDGQVFLSHLGKDGGDLRLPNIADLYPDLASMDDDDTPSCGLAEALAQQALGINKMVANAGLFSILMPLIRNGWIEHHGINIDMTAGTQVALPICKTTWSLYGYSG